MIKDRITLEPRSIFTTRLKDIPMPGVHSKDDLPEPIEGPGRLFLSSTLDSIVEEITAICEDSGHPYSVKDSRLFYSTFSLDGLKTFVRKLEESLNADQLGELQALWVQADRDLQISDLSQMKPLRDFIGRLQGEWLVDLIENNRFYNVFQPIVLAEDPLEIHGYECFIRGRDEDGETIPPGRIFSTAEKSKLIYTLDTIARQNAILNSEGIGLNTKIFINFMSSSIIDPEKSLESTMEALQESDVRHNQLVFEVVETEDVTQREKLIDIFNYYREKGVSIALDDFGTGYSSIGLLTDLKPDYVKLDMDLVQSVRDDPLRQRLAGDILNSASDHGIITLAEGIETEAEYTWFRENGADLLQGFYFSKPAEEPPDTINPSEAA